MIPGTLYLWSYGVPACQGHARVQYYCLHNNDAPLSRDLSCDFGHVEGRGCNNEPGARGRSKSVVEVLVLVMQEVERIVEKPLGSGCLFRARRCIIATH